MKNKTKDNTPADLAIGAISGIIGGFALAGAAQTLYSLTNPKVIAQETKIESKDPFIVLAEKLEKVSGKKMTERQKKIFEQCVAAAISATAGISYSLLESKWNLNWLLGGVAFGALFWAIEDEGISPLLGLVGNNKKYPVEAHIRGLVAHVIFGIVTAAFVKAVKS